jgi:hypothetical protein
MISHATKLSPSLLDAQTTIISTLKTSGTKIA